VAATVTATQAAAAAAVEATEQACDGKGYGAKRGAAAFALRWWLSLVRMTSCGRRRPTAAKHRLTVSSMIGRHHQGGMMMVCVRVCGVLTLIFSHSQ
jgi:hypothetical protein